MDDKETQPAVISFWRKTFRSVVVLLIVALVPALVSAFVHPRRPAWTQASLAADEVTWQEVQIWQKETPSGGVLLVDARTMVEFQRGHVPGAIALSEQKWEEQLPEFIMAWEPGQRIAVYCDDELCNASRGVVERLRRELQATEVYIVKEGWRSWQGQRE